MGFGFDGFKLRVRVMFRDKVRVKVRVKVGVKVRVREGRISTSRTTVHQHTTNAHMSHHQWATDRIILTLTLTLITSSVGYR